MIIDLLFFILMLLGIFKGLKKGLILSMFSFAGFFFAILAAVKLSAIVANRISTDTGYTRWLPALSFLAVFLIVIILVNLTAKLLQHTAEWVMLGWLNRIGGILFHLLIYGILFSIILFYAVQLNLVSKAQTEHSAVFPLIYPLAPAFINTIGKIVPLFQGLFSQLEHFFEAVSDKMQH